jgi:hypothetical protein
MELKKTFLAGKMNKDLDERLLSGGQYEDALNITIDTSEGSNIGSITNSLGNTVVGNITTILSTYSIGSTNARAIGAVAYEPLNLIYWFVSADEYDAIFEYSEITGTMEEVLICTKASASTPSKLNLSKEHLITGVNYMPSHKDSGALLLWTDNYNPPRKINIKRAKSYSVDDSRIDIDIDVILRPPLKAPVIYPVKTDEVLSNNMEERFLYFAYRYKYVDNEYSSMSPFSSVAFQPSEYSIDFLAGINKAMINEYNQCRIVFETGNEFVKEIQLLAFDTRSLNVKIVKSIDKDGDNNNLIQSNSVSDYVFDNNKIYAPITSDQITRLFDNVPLLAKSQEIIGNRLVYGNYTQFRDIIDTDGVNIDMDFSVDYVSTSTTENTPIQSFRTDRDYEVGVIYGDDYGRMTTALISDRNSIYIPPKVSTKGNSIKVNIKNNPPVWATNYRLVVKQAKKEYYNIFPIWFYTDGAYRYFRINESDRDKFAVGDYVIFKADGAGPTFINTQYKILEFESKPFDFLGDEESAGLYFKIKVENTSSFNQDNLPKYGWKGEGTNDIDPTSYFLTGNHSIYSKTNIEGTFGWQHEKIIFYGKGDENSLETIDYYIPNLNHDKRYTIEIESIDPVTYRYTDSVDISYWIESNIPIETVTVVTWQGSGNIGEQIFKIDFNENASYYRGDKWKKNVRANEQQFPYAYPVFSNNAFPNPTNYNVIPPQYANADDAEDAINNLLDPDSGGFGAIYGGFAVCNGGTQLKDSGGNEIDRPINNGDVITIRIKQDSRNPNVNTELQEFFSPGNYENIEEWFIESGAYNQFIQNDSQGNNVGSIGICFRRAAYTPNSGVSDLNTGTNYPEAIRRNLPVRMFIPGYPNEPPNKWNNNKNNIIEVEFKHKQAGAIVCETKPIDEDIEIYHEITDSYDVTNNLHKVGWDYADFTYSTDVFPTVPEGLGYTVLGPLLPTDPQSTDRPHAFSVGQSVYASGTANVPQGYYTVLAVPNQYSIIIDLTWPGNAPSQPATVFKEDWEQDQAVNNNGAIVEINDTTSKNSQYNSFSFGNGVESYRIKDDFNEPEMKYSLRVTSIIEDYENERKEASLTYSGVFRGDTSINRLNEFNLSLANFKDLDRDFGPIEKLYSRDRDIFVFHQDKINKVLYGKNVLYDAVGGGTVASIPEVLGSEIPFPVDYGISNNPESFATNAGDIYFTDARRGAVLGMEKGNVSEISSLGMTDYFRDEFKDNPNKQKIGSYDPYSNRYTLASENTRSVNPCTLSIRPSSRGVTSESSGLSFFMFNISTQQQWAITLVDTGFGTDWVSPVTTSGIGAANIYANVANNTTGSTRTINFVVTYCTSVTQIFTLTQAASKPVIVRPIVINKPEKK